MTDRNVTRPLARHDRARAKVKDRRPCSPCRLNRLNQGIPDRRRQVAQGRLFEIAQGLEREHDVELGPIDQLRPA
jgi:hypothetical protein